MAIDNKRKIKKKSYKNNNLKNNYKEKEDTDKGNDLRKKHLRNAHNLFHEDEKFVNIISKPTNLNEKKYTVNNINSKTKKQLDKYRLKVGFMNHNTTEEFCMQANRVKICYSSISEAKKAIGRYKKEDWGDDKKPTDIYYCNSCDCWHTTSK
jgi:hypothetical protein